MMVLAPTYRGVRQPPPAATVNWNHPITRGLKICTLFNVGTKIHTQNTGPQLRNFADPSNPAVGLNANDLVPGSNVGRGGGSRGLQNLSAQAPGLQYNKIPLNGVAQFSMFVRTTEGLNGTTAPNPVFLAATAPIVSFSQYQNGLYVYFGSTNGWHFVVTNNSATQVFVNAGYVTGSASGQMVDVCGVYDGSNAIVYGNGAKMTSSAQTGTVSTSTTLSHFSDTTANASETYAGVLACAMLWTRALNPAEILALHVSPYQIFRTASIPRWLVATAGGGGGGGLGMRRTLSMTGARAGSRNVHRSW